MLDLKKIKVGTILRRSIANGGEVLTVVSIIKTDYECIDVKVLQVVPDLMFIRFCLWSHFKSWKIIE